MSERVTLSLDDGVSDMLAVLAGGERKRGRWISEVVRAAYENRQTAESSDVNTLRLALAGLSGELTALRGRVEKIEATTVAMMAKEA